jgi:hypothetical protein
MFSNLYLLAGVGVAAIGLVGVVLSRIRRTPSADQVSPNVLDRIRTEYR